MTKIRQHSHQVFRQCSRLLLAGFFSPIINTSVFSEFNSKKISRFLYRLCIPLVSQFGVFHQAVKKYRAEYHQHNSES